MSGPNPLFLYVKNNLQSTEVSSSNRMEAEGLQRCLNYLRTQEMSVDILVTDQHLEGKASLRDHYPEINHRFDVWHAAKGMIIYSSTAGVSNLFAVAG